MHFSVMPGTRFGGGVSYPSAGGPTDKAETKKGKHSSLELKLAQSTRAVEYTNRIFAER